VGSGSVWFANQGGTTVSRVDASSGDVMAAIEVEETVLGVAAVADSVWVATGEGSIMMVDAATLEASHVASVPGRPVDIATSGDSVWVLWVDEGGAGFVSRVVG